MTILTKLQRLQGRELYEYYVEVLHRVPSFHYTFPKFHPVQFQYDDWNVMDEITEAVFVRSAGGSKTFDTVAWLVLHVILNPYEKWAWLASQSGQLVQARIYFECNPFVKKVGGAKGQEFVQLINGSKILFRGTTKSITGVRLDGIILDEEEMLDPQQIEIVYPQLHARMSNSDISKFFHLGTMQYATLFMKNIEEFPSFIHPWDECPWLISAGQIQRHIDAGIMPEFEINMLYRCIPSVPGGLFFQNLQIIEPYDFDPDLVDYGLDFGGIDRAVGVLIDGDVCTIVDEREGDIEADNSVFDDLSGNNVAAEGGMYNDDIRFSAKCQIMIKRIGAKRVLPTVKWKKSRKFQARGFRLIRIIKKNCQKTLTDMQGCMFGPNGLWLKDKKHPCHWVDGFMLAIASGTRGKIYKPSEEHKEPDRARQLLKIQKERSKFGIWS